MTSPATSRPVSRPIHHIGYTVDDIAVAVDRWVTTFGAGPFFWFARNTAITEARYYGKPCVLEQSVVVAKWNDIFVELVELHEVSPPGLRQALVGNTTSANHINHICYVAEDPEAEVQRLEAAGMPRFWHAPLGAFDVSYCDAWASLGHAIEVHQPTPDFVAIFEAIATASTDWDGTDPLRELPV
ncbi:MULTISPECIES: VOC family protein [unclassified Mycobacterium]|uniref:VOC family protein n=1 Tax=unclassified Mycobacterium TaxID=2642494 RepID=UPI0029C69EDA|nr:MULTISPECIES: VOC family protein [unclassified Mycobacterium]